MDYFSTFIQVLQTLLDIMPPGLSRLLVLFVFKATKDSPKEC